MSALFPAPLSAPARRVEPCEPMLLTVEHYSRTLDEHHPYARSSTAQIVAMDADEPMHPVDVIVVRWSAVCVIALIVLFAWEYFA